MVWTRAISCAYALDRDGKPAYVQSVLPIAHPQPDRFYRSHLAAPWLYLVRANKPARAGCGCLPRAMDAAGDMKRRHPATKAHALHWITSEMKSKDRSRRSGPLPTTPGARSRVSVQPKVSSACAALFGENSSALGGGRGRALLPLLRSLFPRNGFV